MVSERNVLYMLWLMGYKLLGIVSSAAGVHAVLLPSVCID